MGAEGGPLTEDEERTVRRVSDAFEGPIVANGHFDAASAAEHIASGRADAVTFGRLFLANPDLPARLRHGTTDFNEPIPKRFYGGGPEGYIDYPTLQ